MHEESFGAPWSTSLKVLTTLSIILLLGVPILIAVSATREGTPSPTVIVVAPLLMVLIAACFLIRGYVLTQTSLYVRRLGWRTTIDLKELKSVEIDPAAMEKSLRTFGNGGLFCFAGRFRNAKLGTYRAWATDPARCVILRFPDHTIVVTPDDPTRFAAALRSRQNIP